jgi:membrane protein DedA with SNARE-associated domain
MAVLIGRFLIGFRAPVFIVAGASKVRFRSFLLYNSLGLLVAVPAFIYLGFAFGEGINDLVFQAMARMRELVVVTALAAGLWTWWSVRNSGKDQ